MEWLEGVQLKKLRSIYNSMRLAEYDVPSEFTKWVESVVWYLPTDTGGLVFLSDNDEKSLLWLMAFCPGTMPAYPVLKWCLLVCRQLGFELLAVTTIRPGAARLFENIGLQKIEAGLYAIRLNG